MQEPRETRIHQTPELGRSPERGNGNPHQYSCWKSPWTEESGGLQSIGSQRAGMNEWPWTHNLHDHSFRIFRLFTFSLHMAFLPQHRFYNQFPFISNEWISKFILPSLWFFSCMFSFQFYSMRYNAEVRITVLFSCSVLSDSLRSHGLQHTKLLCPSLSPRACSNSYPLSQWCYLTMSSSAALFFFPIIRVSSGGSALHIRWPKYWSFSISPSDKYSSLISFKFDWFDLLASPKDSWESSPAPQFEISSLVLSFLNGYCASILPNMSWFWEMESIIQRYE